MVRRSRRHLDLLQTIDMEPDFKRHPDEVHSSKMRDRPMHKDEIVRVCEILDVNPAGIVAELRNQLRSFSGLYEDKQDSSQFSTNELFYLSRHCNDALRLDAEDVDIYDKIADWGGKLQIVTEDDEHHVEVVEKGKADWKDSWDDSQRFESYEMYRLSGRHFDNGRRHRLMVLRGQDPDSCKYRGSVVLERPKDYGPYKQWRKKSYVREVTPVTGGD